MINIIRSAQRHHENHGWLDTRWHFSFADYRDPDNMNFGPLRVFNDDVISPGGGFDLHPHRDMEIISYVVRGALAHTDSTGSEHVNTRGGVQVMSAGRGIFHAEHNASDTEPTHLLQLWIMPRTRGLPPRWAEKSFDAQLNGGGLVPIVSDGSIPGTLAIDQDAAIYVARPSAGDNLLHTTSAGRRAYAFVITGRVSLNGIELAAGDQARIEGESALRLNALENSELILLDLP